MEAQLRGRKGSVVFALILLANQGDSPGQPKRSLRAATAVRYNYDVQLVATRRNSIRVPNLQLAKGGGVKLVVHITV